MIVVDKPMLKFLLAGRAVDITAPREYKKGSIQHVGIRAKRPICRVEVLERWHDGQVWKLSVRQWTQDTPLYLAATFSRGDYTTVAAMAAREADGSPIEAVRGDGWFERATAAASERDDQLRREQAHAIRIARKRGRNTSDLQVKWSAAPVRLPNPGRRPVGLEQSSTVPASDA